MLLIRVFGPYAMIDDEALEDARRRMDGFQRQRGLLGSDDRAARIQILKDELRDLEDSGDTRR